MVTHPLATLDFSIAGVGGLAQTCAVHKGLLQLLNGGRPVWKRLGDLFAASWGDYLRCMQVSLLSLRGT